jgi:parallel beta-helix repeat protein
MTMRGKRGERGEIVPAAFMSYARTDDRYGNITTFRERLALEIEIQTGQEFSIFQDSTDIGWGENWKRRIEQSLNAVTFLIPVFSPSFFNSTQCRDELRRFLEREKQLGRDDLILPVYFIDCPILSAPDESDSVLKEIATRQYVDWRDLRFEPFTSSQVGKTLAGLAKQLRNALARSREQGSPARRTRNPKKSNIAKEELSHRREIPSPPIPEIAPLLSEGQITAHVSIKTEPPVLVVDPLFRGNHTTIAAAIRAANAGDRILVRPGLYSEALVIDKPLELLGQGDSGEVVIETSANSVLVFRATMGRVSNLTLRQNRGGAWYGVEILQGRLELEDCEILSDGLACVAIHSGADPRLRRNRIHGGKEGGVYIYSDGHGTLEDNDIFENAMAGIAIAKGGNPTIRNNRIHDGKEGGVYVYDGGAGTLEENEIFGNAYSGIAIKSGGCPTIRRNRIYQNRRDGVYVFDGGQGTIEENDIFENSFAGVAILTGGNPTLRHNRIHNGKRGGLYVYENGRGVIEDNEIVRNVFAEVVIMTGGDPTLRRNVISEGNEGGVYVCDGGQGTLEENQIFGNAYSGIAIKSSGNPVCRQNRIYQNKRDGVYVFDNGQGILEDNEVFDNGYAGVAILTGGNPTLRRNRIYTSKRSGVCVYENGRGILEGNEIFSNALAGLAILTGGNPIVRNNRIHKNDTWGVWIYQAGMGAIEGNTLEDNGKGSASISPDSMARVVWNGNTAS